MNDVMSYSDYRQYIRDYYETHKAVNPAFSFRYLSQKAGINSSAFFKFLIEGKRNLTKNTILKACQALNLKDHEAEYFEQLVFFNQSKTLREKNHYFEKLIALQRNGNIYKISEDHYEYFAEWFHCVIRELVTIIDFNGDFNLLAKAVRPAITAKQAEHSVMLLLKLGFLKRVDGKYVQTEPVVSTGYGISSHRITQFQITLLRLAIEAFDRCKDSERLMSSTTISLSKKNFDLYVKKLRELRSQLLELSRNDTGQEAVYQLALSFFPVSNNNCRGGIHA